MSALPAGFDNWKTGGGFPGCMTPREEAAAKAEERQGWQDYLDSDKHWADFSEWMKDWTWTNMGNETNTNRTMGSLLAEFRAEKRKQMAA